MLDARCQSRMAKSIYRCIKGSYDGVVREEECVCVCVCVG